MIRSVDYFPVRVYPKVFRSATIYNNLQKIPQQFTDDKQQLSQTSFFFFFIEFQKNVIFFLMCLQLRFFLN